MEINPIDLLNVGTHGVLTLVIIYLLRQNTALLAEIRRLTDALISLRVSFEDEIVASGGFGAKSQK